MRTILKTDLTVRDINEGFVYNENNPYLLRPKPSITNDFGINKMTEFAIKTLFQKLSNTYNKKINHRDVRISGILFAYDNYLKSNEDSLNQKFGGMKFEIDSSDGGLNIIVE